MLDEDAVWNDYMERERAANAKPQGADPQAILKEVADKYGIEYAHARRIILDRTVMGGG